MCLEATAINQFRLHKGYHYPRSPETARECQQGLKSFKKEYSTIDAGRQYYAIAKEGSKTSSKQYRDFCIDNNLPCTFALWPPYLDHNSISLCLKVDESRLNPDTLRSQLSASLKSLQVEVKLETAFVNSADYDHIVVAAYASTNAVMLDIGCEPEEFQFEVIEKPVLRLPKEMMDFGVVIMDGPFCSLDPFGNTGTHVMGHVEHAIHHTNTGFFPEIPEHLIGCMNRGVVQNCRHSRYEDFISAGKRFVPALTQAEHIGSMYTVRAVLPNKDETDERPTLVTEVDSKVLRIFSGKIGTSVTAAQDVLSILRKRDGFVSKETRQALA